MRRWNHVLVVLACVVLGAVLLAGCSGGKSKDDVVTPKHEPVTLKLYNSDADYEKQFKEQIASKVTQKYPYISFEFQGASEGKEIQDLVAAGDSPDIYYQGLSALQNQLFRFNLQYEMADTIKQEKFDLNRIDPGFLKIISNASASFGGQYYGLPVVGFVPVLFYNKDIFDKFGVSYPKDGLTWDEAYELAKRLTVYQDGVQYRGLGVNVQYSLDNNQLGAVYFDPKQDRAAVNTDKWKTVFSTLTRFYQLPMNTKMTKASNGSELTAFTKDRNLAMYEGVTGAINKFPDDFHSWDMVATPTMKEAPKTNIQLNPRFYYMMSSSKHKEEAFKVIDFVLSDAMQMELSRSGQPTVLLNPEVRKAYGQDFPMIKGKHLEAMYFNPPVAPDAPRDPKLVIVQTNKMAGETFNEILSGAKDVNTALREFDENLNKAIAAEKSK
jgi:multiple sugar transport system substrate-binding protein